jgi:hypothetical protein
MHGMEGQHTGMRSYDELMLSAAICMAHNCGIEFIEVVNADGTLYSSPYRTYRQIFDAMRSFFPYLGGEKIRCVAVYISAETKEYLYETNAEQLVNLYGKVKDIEAAWQYTSTL